MTSKEESLGEFNFVKLRLIQSKIISLLNVFGLILIGIGNLMLKSFWLLDDPLLNSVIALNFSGFIILLLGSVILIIWWSIRSRRRDKSNIIIEDKELNFAHNSLFYNQMFQFLYALVVILVIFFDVLNPLPRTVQPGSTALFFSRILSAAIYLSSSGLKTIGIILELIGLWKLLKIAKTSPIFNDHLKPMKFLILMVSLRLIASLPILIVFGIPLFIESTLLMISLVATIKMKQMYKI